MSGKGLAEVRAIRCGSTSGGSPEPDLMVIRDEHLHRITPKRLEGPRGLGHRDRVRDPKFDLREKLPRYQEAGIEEIWFLNSFVRTLRVETRVVAWAIQ